MKVTGINNPRKSNGDLGDIVCGLCYNSSSALLALETTVFHRPHEVHKTIICKGCLLDWVELINKTMLDDIVRKGRLTKYGK